MEEDVVLASDDVRDAVALVVDGAEAAAGRYQLRMLLDLDELASHRCL